MHPNQQVAFDIRTISTRTEKGNIKVLAILDTSTRYIRARAIPDERAETIAQVLVEDFISILRPIETFLSDGGPNLTSGIIRNLAGRIASLGFIHIPFTRKQMELWKDGTEFSSRTWYALFKR